MATRFASIGIACVLLCLVSLNAAHAAVFYPNYLLSDAELTDSLALDLQGIQQHLSRGSLVNLSMEDHNGVIRTAPEIIWQAALEHSISPKFLIVLLQKEQGLVEDDSPTEIGLAWATGYGICDDCSKSDPLFQRWKGFGKQVNSAAAQFREGYLLDLAANGRTSAGFAPGKETYVDGVPVTPANNATAALYSYTPHLHGNELFVNLWSRYFSQLYPSGSLLSVAGEPGVWLITHGERRPITSQAALVSRYNPEAIIQVDSSTLYQYSIGQPISFPNYSLLRSPKGTVYLIVDDTRRGIDSMETFRSIGFNEDEILDVSVDELDAFTEGPPITLESVYPQGHLLQDTTTGGVYFVIDGIKHPLASKTILEVNFSNWRIHPTAPDELLTYQVGDKVLLPEGTLIKAVDEPAVYIISEGTRRPIVSGDVFELFGFSWENVIEADAATVNLHPLGDPLTMELEDQSVEMANE